MKNKIIPIIITMCVLFNLLFINIYATEENGNENGNITELFSFEEEDIGYITVESGQFGKIISDRKTYINSSEPVNKVGECFLSTVDTESGEGNDEYTGIIKLKTFKVSMPYMALMIGGGLSDQIYVALCDLEGNELLRIKNYYSTENMTRVVVDLNEYMGQSVYLKVVDNSSDYYGFILLDDIKLCMTHEDADAIPESDYLFSEDFSSGVMPSGFTNSDGWKVLQDPDFDMVVRNNGYSGGSSLLTFGLPEWDNYSLSFRMKGMQQKMGAALHVNFRMQDADAINCYRAVIYESGDVAVREVVDGSANHEKITSGVLTNGIMSSNTVQIIVNGGLIELYINGQKCGQGNSDSYTSGQISFMAYNLQVDIDDIEVKKVKERVAVTGISVPENTINMQVGDIMKIVPDIVPENADNKTVKYISRNLDVVTITPEGIMRAINPGSAPLVIRTNDGNYEAELTINVNGEGFIDTVGHWAEKDIIYASAQGIVQGRGNGIFSPSDSVTEEEFLLMAERTYGVDCTDFGVSSTKNAITREKAFKVAAEGYKKYTGLLQPTIVESNFADKDEISDEYKEAIDFIYTLQIADGDENGNINPKSTITRAESAKILGQIKNRLTDDEIRFENDNADYGFGIRNSMHFKAYEPNRDIIYYVRQYHADDEGTVKVSLEGTNVEYYDEKEFQFKPGEFFEVDGSFKAEKNGIYILKYVYDDKDGIEIFNKSISIAVCNKADGAADDYFLYGMQPHFSFVFTRTHWDHNFEGMDKYGTLNLSFELMDWLGCNLVREGPSILSSEEEAALSPDEWSWLQSDEVVKMCDERGMYLLFGFNNKGAVIEPGYEGKGNWFTVPKTDDSVFDAISKCMDRYSYDRIIYEMGNEVNYPSYYIGTEQEYVDQYLDVTARIKNKNPNTLISSPGLVADGPGDDIIFYNGFKQAQQAGTMDYYAYHSHSDFQGFIDVSWAQVKGFLDESGLLWEGNALLDEAGLDMSDKQRQANEVMRKYLFAFGNNHKGVVFYLLRQYPEIAQAGGEGGFSMVSVNGDMRDVFVTYRVLIEQLNGTKSVSQISNEGIYAYRFEKQDSSVISVFADDKTKGKYFKVSGICKVLDMYGNEVESADKYEITEEPYYVVCESADSNITIE